eukprot:g19195.t1
MARSSKLITLAVALTFASLALQSLTFLGVPSRAGSATTVSPAHLATAAAVPVLLTPTAALAADGGMPSVVLGVGILCMLAAFSAVSSDFVKMELPLPSHEHVRKQGLLHRRKRSFYCIFISHQWVSSEHPDPEGKQLAVLQECLTKICDGSIEALEKRALGEFLEDFHFDVDAKTTTMSPLLCACLSGDLQLVKTLLQQEGLNLHTPLKSMMQVGIAEGLTALHVLLMHGWRCPGVLEVVLEAKADVNLVSKGIPVLAYCRSENCKPEVIDSLLEARADPNGRSGGIGATQPLALLSMNAASNPHAMEVAKMLVLAKSDINQVCRASGLFYGLELLNRTYLRFARPRSNLMLLTAEWSTTPLGFACMFGNRQLVELLLKARGDLHRRNARGHTPLQLAKSQEVIDAIEDYIQDEEALLLLMYDMELTPQPVKTGHSLFPELFTVFSFLLPTAVAYSMTALTMVE